jgi:hypothetical protein
MTRAFFLRLRCFEGDFEVIDSEGKPDCDTCRDPVEREFEILAGNRGEAHDHVNRQP